MEFTIQTILPVKRKKIYNAWLNSKMHTKMTGADAQISDQIEGTFLAWDGYISGTNIILEYKKRIVQYWRTTEFADNEQNSKVEILLNKVKEGTEITIHHTNLPADGIKYKEGWEDFYFKPMRAYFEKE